MTSMDLEGNQARIKKIKLNDFTVQGGHTYINCSQLSTRTIQIVTVLSLYFSDPFLMEGLSHYIAPYLSTRPSRHPLWLSVNCGSQCSIIQRYSPHKYGQKSSCNAFNAVAAAFPQIFLDSLPSCMFMRHVPTIRASWKVILITGMHTWTAYITSGEEFLLGPPSIRSLLMRR